MPRIYCVILLSLCVLGSASKLGSQRRIPVAAPLSPVGDSLSHAQRDSLVASWDRIVEDRINFWSSTLSPAEQEDQFGFLLGAIVYASREDLDDDDDDDGVAMAAGGEERSAQDFYEALAMLPATLPVPLVEEMESDMPGIGDFPKTGFRALLPLPTARAASHVQQYLYSRLVPVEVSVRDSATYLITARLLEPAARNQRRDHRTTYLVVLTHSGSRCTSVFFSWIRESKGVRERTWRRTEEDANEIPLFAGQIGEMLRRVGDC